MAEFTELNDKGTNFAWHEVTREQDESWLTNSGNPAYFWQ